MKTEPATLRVNYLNGDYAPDAVSTWQAGRCYATIQRKLGYRFQVTRDLRDLNVRTRLG